MRDAPWMVDDPAVLREKWRLAEALAANCELAAHHLSITRIQLDHCPDGGVEAAEFTQECRHQIARCAQTLTDTGLTRTDWKWFSEKHLAEELDSIGLMMHKTLESATPVDLAKSAEQLCAAVALAKRRFADTLRLSLNAIETTGKTGSWYQVVDAGIRIHGKVIELEHRAASILELLCRRKNQFTNYDDIAELNEGWATAWDTLEDLETVKSNIRNKVADARNAIRKVCNLPEGHDPIVNQPHKGWKLSAEAVSPASYQG